MFQIKGIDTYNGGKSGSGTYQTIINQIPPHKIYIEPFLGMGAILRYKRLAELSICSDLDKSLVYEIWQPGILKNQLDSIKIHCKNGIDLLNDICSNDIFTDARVFCYLDPPYPMQSRKSDRPRYKHEMTDEDHIRLLRTIKDTPFNVAISSYSNPLYNEFLSDWRKLPYTSQTRAGKANEMLYMNYPEPTELHDYNYLGNDYRERERIKRKILRHVDGLKRLPTHERAAILQALNGNLSF